MHYRLYQPADFAQLYAVEELCFEPPFRFSRALMRKLIANASSATWIAEENSELAGFAIVDWATVPKGTVAYIQTIEVHPASRRRGIARRAIAPLGRLRSRRRRNRNLAACRRREFRRDSSLRRPRLRAQGQGRALLRTPSRRICLRPASQLAVRRSHWPPLSAFLMNAATLSCNCFTHSSRT